MKAKKRSTISVCVVADLAYSARSPFATSGRFSPASSDAMGVVGCLNEEEEEEEERLRSRRAADGSAWLWLGVSVCRERRAFFEWSDGCWVTGWLVVEGHNNTKHKAAAHRRHTHSGERRRVLGFSLLVGGCSASLRAACNHTPHVSRQPPAIPTITAHNARQANGHRGEPALAARGAGGREAGPPTALPGHRGQRQQGPLASCPSNARNRRSTKLIHALHLHCRRWASGLSGSSFRRPPGRRRTGTNT